MTRTAYMDYNATAPVFPSVAAAMADVLTHVGNPSSVHRLGRQARAKMEDAREAVAAMINVPADWVIFTSCGTEADALALTGLDVERVLVSAVEHAAVLKVRDDAEVLSVDGNGVIDLVALEEALKADDRKTLRIREKILETVWPKIFSSLSEIKNSTRHKVKTTAVTPRINAWPSTLPS